MKEAIAMSSHPTTRRRLLATAALTVASCAIDPRTFAADEPAGARGANNADMPRAELLTDGDVKTYLLVFHTGQEVMKGLVAFAREHKLVAGRVTGIGALSDAVVGYFEPEQKTYVRIQEEGQHELLSLNGNLALYQDSPFYHVHVALGLRDGTVRGGHLFSAIVRPTTALVLTTYAKPVHRQLDPACNLPLINP